MEEGGRELGAEFDEENASVAAQDTDIFGFGVGLSGGDSKGAGGRGNAASVTDQTHEGKEDRRSSRKGSSKLTCIH